MVAATDFILAKSEAALHRAVALLTEEHVVIVFGCAQRVDVVREHIAHFEDRVNRRQTPLSRATLTIAESGSWPHAPGSRTAGNTTAAALAYSH